MGPPRGPRGGSAARPSRNVAGARTTDRGGIQKRRAAGPRTDMDGDLDMDGEGRRAKRPAVGDAKTSRPTRAGRGGRGSAAAPPRMPSKQAQIIARHLNGGGPLASRIANVTTRSQRTPPTLVWLRVKGLKESKAATNPGGGVKDLLHFLERKATSLANRTSNRPVAIKQVSYLLPDEENRGRFESDADGPNSPCVATKLLQRESTRTTIPAA